MRIGQYFAYFIKNRINYFYPGGQLGKNGYWLYGAKGSYLAPRSKHISKSNWNCLHSCTIDYVTSPKHQFSLKRARGRLRILPPLPIKIIKLCCGHCCKWIYLKKRNKCEIKYSWWRVWRCILLFNFYTFQIKVRVTFTGWRRSVGRS